MSPWSLLPLWGKALVIAAVIACIGMVVHTYNERLRDEGRDEKQAQWTADNLRREREANVQREKNSREGFRRVEQQAAIEQRKTNEIASLSDRVAGLRGELRNRPERPTGSSGAAGNSAPAASCTGAQLYRGDADFLVGEAARAERVRIERDSCHDKYDALTVKP